MPRPTVCEWHGPGKPGQQEVASISLVNGKVSQITIKAAVVGTATQSIRLGALARWKTSRGIGLGSKRSAVAKAYPTARPNTGEAVNGYDLFAGSRPNLAYTRFAANGVSRRTATACCTSRSPGTSVTTAPAERGAAVNRRTRALDARPAHRVLMPARIQTADALRRAPARGS